MKLYEIAGDSSVTHVAYANGVAEINIIDGETGDTLRLRVSTHLFFSEASTTERGTAFVQLLALKDYLPVHLASGRFISPETFEQQMTAIRGALHLAYGLRATEYPFLFLVRDNRVYFGAPVRSESEIVITEESTP
jgi:hypothetical protein